MSNPDMEHTMYEECFSEYYQVQDDENQDPTDEQTEAEHLGDIPETVVMAPSVEDVGEDNAADQRVYEEVFPDQQDEPEEDGDQQRDNQAQRRPNIPPNDFHADSSSSDDGRASDFSQ